MAETGRVTGRGGQRDRLLLRWLYSGVLLLLLLMLYATYRTYQRFTSASESAREANTVLHEVEALGSGLKDAQTGVRSYILTHDTALLAPFNAAQPGVDRSIRRLDSLNRAGAVHEDLDGYIALSRTMMKQVQDQFLAERSSPIGLQGDERTQLSEGHALMERVRQEQARITAAIEEARDRDQRIERSLKPDTPLMLLIYTALAIAATAMLFWRLFRALKDADRAKNDTQAKVVQLDEEVSTRIFAERSLRRVLDSSPSSIMAFRSLRDQKGRISDFEWLLTNQESERLYGGRTQGLVGRKLLDVMPGLRENGTFERLVDVVESGTPLEDTITSVQRPDNWVHFHALRLLDGFMITVTDVTETRRAQGFLAESDRLAITGGIARTIAHEVRNPLTNLQMALEQMVEELSSTDRDAVRPFTEILHRNIKRIAGLIDDLLESSKIKELAKYRCDTNTLLAKVLATVQDRLDLQHMTSRIIIKSGAETVLADEGMLCVALSNLCINAIEAMEPGKGQLELTAGLVGDRVQICVEDNGKGIAQENIQRLFQAFYSGRRGGMGLGLTSARTILNAHGVHMEVHSELGKGTRFSLTFPA